MPPTGGSNGSPDGALVTDPSTTIILVLLDTCWLPISRKDFAALYSPSVGERIGTRTYIHRQRSTLVIRLLFHGASSYSTIPPYLPPSGEELILSARSVWPLLLSVLR
jgi:hypothetical protein